MRPDGRQLGIYRREVCICWLRVPGMMWSRVVYEVECYAWHAGGNDLGVRTIRELISDIKSDFFKLRTAFPNTMLLWSDIVARTMWRMARSVARINKARIRVNKVVGRFSLGW